MWLKVSERTKFGILKRGITLFAMSPDIKCKPSCIAFTCIKINKINNADDNTRASL